MSPDALNDKIDAWHDGAGPAQQELHEYLGWTFEEFAHWVLTDEQPVVHNAAGACEPGYHRSLPGPPNRQPRCRCGAV